MERNCTYAKNNRYQIRPLQERDWHDANVYAHVYVYAYKYACAHVQINAKKYYLPAFNEYKIPMLIHSKKTQKFFGMNWHQLASFFISFLSYREEK